MFQLKKIPDYLLEEVLGFISNIKFEKSNERKIHTFKLKGRFDNVNIRSKAYE